MKKLLLSLLVICSLATSFGQTTDIRATLRSVPTERWSLGDWNHLFDSLLVNHAIFETASFTTITSSLCQGT